MNTIHRSPPSNFRADLSRWQHLVTPHWLNGLLTGAEIIAAPVSDWRVFEIGFGSFDLFKDGHIPHAGYIDTIELENAPLWNKVPDQALLKLLLRHGIRHDTTVVLYGRNSLAAARAAHLMLYAGVKDVRLLDGGFAGWCRSDLPLSRDMPFQHPEVADFGARFPVHPDYLTDMAQTRDLLQHDDHVLVSIRTWKEFIGATSGYAYIDARGEIPGALWGRAGKDEDVNSMSEFHSVDGTMKSAADILRMWHAGGICPGQKTTFYCGTGWRASLAFFYAWLMGWERISVYDGGWYEWSSDPANPVICRLPVVCS